MGYWRSILAQRGHLWSTSNNPRSKFGGPRRLGATPLSMSFVVDQSVSSTIPTTRSGTRLQLLTTWRTADKSRTISMVSLRRKWSPWWEWISNFRIFVTTLDVILILEIALFIRMENAESIEQMLKPTRKRRGILLFLFFLLASIQVASSFQIQSASNAYNVHEKGVNYV